MILLLFLCALLWFLWGVYRLVGYRYRSFSGKIVLVTGACSELGRRLCVQLRADGASVIAWDGSRVRLEELRRDILGTRATAATMTAIPSTATSSSRRTYSPSPPSSSPSASVLRGDGKLPTSSASPSPSGLGDSHQSHPPHRVDSKDGGEPFFEIAMVDLSSRLQVQRAVKELTTALPTLCAHLSRPVNALGVDVIFNGAHASPRRGLHDRGEDTVERVLTTNTMAPLLLAKLLCPAMLERRRGGHVVTFTAAEGASMVSADSPDYAASQWGAVGAHYSIRRWVRQLRESQKLPGNVLTTLVSLDIVQLSSPSVHTSGSSFAFTTASNHEVSGGGSAVTATLLAKSSRSETGSEVGGSPQSESSGSAAQTASLAMDRQVQRVLRAVARGEESVCPSYRAAFAPVAFLLPVPWMAVVLQCLGIGRSNASSSAKEKSASNEDSV